MNKTNQETEFEWSRQHTLTPWSPQGNGQGLNIVSARGARVETVDGQSLLDFSSQLICSNIGHGDLRVAEAISEQFARVDYVAPAHHTEMRGRLGKKLADIAPGDLNRTFFTVGGADAIENAVKLARHYTGRPKILAKYRSYHGGTHGALATGGDPRKIGVDSQAMSGVIHFEDPYCYRCPWNQSGPGSCARECLAHLERIIQFEGPGQIAALVLEGESGSSGCVKYPEGYWRAARELTRKHGILLIDDEVMSGFGRTGKWFAVEHHLDTTAGEAPDMICLAKGLTAATLPLGGVIVSEKIAASYDQRPLPLGLTYSAHPVCLAASLRVLKIYEDDDLITRAARTGEKLRSGLEKLRERHPSLGDIRLTGLLGALELVTDREYKTPLAVWNATADQMKAMNQVAAKLREHNLLTLVRWNWIFLAPPLTLTDAELEEALAALDAALEVADSFCSGGPGTE